MSESQQTWALPPNAPIAAAYQLTFSVGRVHRKTTGSARESTCLDCERAIMARLPRWVFDRDTADSMSSDRGKCRIDAS